MLNERQTGEEWFGVGSGWIRFECNIFDLFNSLNLSPSHTDMEHSKCKYELKLFFFRRLIYDD